MYVYRVTKDMGKSKNKINAYWLFALDCASYLENLANIHLKVITINYIASNIWPNLSSHIKLQYKYKALQMRANGLRPRPVGLLTLDKCIELVETNGIFDVLHETNGMDTDCFHELTALSTRVQIDRTNVNGGCFVWNVGYVIGSLIHATNCHLYSKKTLPGQLIRDENDCDVGGRFVR